MINRTIIWRNPDDERLRRQPDPPDSVRAIAPCQIPPLRLAASFPMPSMHSGKAPPGRDLAAEDAEVGAYC